MIFSRIFGYKFHIKPLLMPFINIMIDKLGTYSGVIEDKRETPVIISLTSIKERFKDLPKTIYSLIKQSRQPDRIILWLSDEFGNVSNLPYEITQFIKNGLEILVFTLLKNVKNKKIDFFTRLMGKRTVKKYFRKRSSKKQIFTATYTGKLSKKKMQENHHMRNIKNNNQIKEKESENKSVSYIELILEDESETNTEDDIFIKMKELEYKKPIDKSQLVEYDSFYKQQFFKNELFLYDVENIEDKVEAEIKKEMNRLEIKRKLIGKKKLKEVNDLKKLDTTDLQKEIDDLQKAYENCNTVVS